MKQLTREAATALYESGEWKDWTVECIVGVLVVGGLLGFFRGRY